MLRDPYEVLEINKGATKEEIQKAYRRLVKQYHPDQYRNHPLEKLAEEKLAEINEAYDYLMKNGGGAGNYSGSQGSYRYNSGSDNSFFQQVRVYINNGDLYKAEQMLNQSNSRTAQWFYLKGVVFLRKGWYAEALYHFQTAVNMEPGNAEFRNALNTMNQNNNMYRQRSEQYGGQDADLCTLCQCLICTDCCCECMGGDFITCC